MQDSQRQTDHLQVLTSGGGGDVARLRADIVDDGLLQPGDEEMGAFVDHLVLHTGQSVEDDGAGTAADVVDGGVEEVDTAGDGDGESVEVVEPVGGHGEAVGGQGNDGDEDQSRDFGDDVMSGFSQAVPNPA